MHLLGVNVQTGLVDVLLNDNRFRRQTAHQFLKRRGKDYPSLVVNQGIVSGGKSYHLLQPVFDEVKIEILFHNITNDAILFHPESPEDVDKLFIKCWKPGSPEQAQG
jgi:hypothetical protein